MTRAASAPDVSETWPSSLTSRSSARYSTSGREASAATAAAGRLTARTGKFSYDFVTEPLLFLTASSSALPQAPADFTTTSSLPPPPSFCRRSDETLSRAGVWNCACAVVAPRHESAETIAASVARRANVYVSLPLLIKIYPFGLDRGFVRPLDSAALNARAVPTSGWGG